MTTAPRYLTRVEALAIIQAEMLSTDRRRIEFEALSNGDQDVVIAQATADIDACLWMGADYASDQQTRWPRRWDRPRVWNSSDCAVGSYIDEDPNPPADPAVAGLPAGVRLAAAFQAAHRALLAAGLSPAAHVDEAANKGVTSQSAGGVSESIDLKRANSAWSALCREAQRAMSPYRRSGGSMV